MWGSNKKGPDERGLDCIVAVGSNLKSAICNLRISWFEWWAHQDSNLERAGYEPAALTVELWARIKPMS